MTETGVNDVRQVLRKIADVVYEDSEGWGECKHGERSYAAEKIVRCETRSFPGKSEGERRYHEWCARHHSRGNNSVSIFKSL